MIRNVTGVCQGHGQLGPGLIAEVEFGGIELVVENASLAATKLGMKVVGHEAVDYAGALAYGSVAELQEGGGGGRIFVFAEDLVGGLCIISRHFLDLRPHAEKEGVKGVASGGEEGAAPILPGGIPPVLPIPGTYPVVIVNLTIVDVSDETFLNLSLIHI